MTDVQGESDLALRNTLEAAASAAGHEVRNALNGLVVNLEVVRSMAAASGFVAEPFMTQAVMQSEESIRLAEAAIALMRLLAGAVGENARVSSRPAKGRQVDIEAGPGADRISSALQPLHDRGVLSVETSGSTVILRIPEEAQTEQE